MFKILIKFVKVYQNLNNDEDDVDIDADVFNIGEGSTFKLVPNVLNSR